MRFIEISRYALTRVEGEGESERERDIFIFLLSQCITQPFHNFLIFIVFVVLYRSDKASLGGTRNSTIKIQINSGRGRERNCNNNNNNKSPFDSFHSWPIDRLIDFAFFLYFAHWLEQNKNKIVLFKSNGGNKNKKLMNVDGSQLATCALHTSAAISWYDCVTALIFVNGCAYFYFFFFGIKLQLQLIELNGKRDLPNIE